MRALVSLLAIAGLNLAGTADIRAQGAAAPASIDDLAWLGGHWSSGDDGRWSEEHWLPPSGGSLLGVNRSGCSQGAGGFEFLRIQADADGTPVYWASPGGAPAVAFRMTAWSTDSVTFENPANDFPRRIVYRRDGDLLIATISNGDDEPRMSWTWTRSD